MTEADLQARKILFPTPFAGADANATEIPITSGSAPITVADGFGSAYNVPKSQGGRYISRNDMNGVLKLATRDTSFRQCGGLYTFDESLCGMIGGYAKGAVLSFFDDEGILHFVRSLVDHNTYNFVTRGVDNENWTYCLPNEAANQYIPDIDWDASKAIELVTIGKEFYFPFNDASWERIDTNNAGVSGYGTFPSKGYVCGWGTIQSVASFYSGAASITYRLQISIGSNALNDVSNINPQSIMTALPSDRPKAFARDLCAVWRLSGQGNYSFTTDLFQVEAGTSYSIWGYSNVPTGSGSNFHYPFNDGSDGSTGTIRMFFLPLQ